MPTITIENLTKEYSVGSGTEVAVDGISLEVGESEFLTLVGPSGCGKTTTLRCIAGLETPTSGRILYDGEDITDVPANKRGLAMMFQDIALYPHMTAVENIAYPLKIDNVPKAKRREKAEEAAEIMQIEELLDKYPGELSGGQQQRVALARTIVQDPRAFLMDEPLSDLDAKLQVEIRKEVQRVHNRLKKPTVYVTHNQEEAITMSDRIAVMNDGRIEQIGTRDDLYHYPSNLFVARFIGNPSMNFFDAAVESLTGDGGALTVGDVHLEFDVDRLFTDDGPRDAVLADGDTSKMIVGTRPVSLSVSRGTRDGGLGGELQLLEPIDDRALATVEMDQGEVVAQIPADQDIDVGDTVTVIFESADLYLFDPDTGELVATSS